jgi:hypothetical protein
MAIWRPSGQPVPVERVLANVQAQIKDHPNDASTWLVLGRLLSYAFFTGSQQVPMNGAKPVIPNLPEAPRTKEPAAENFTNLKQSILAFRKSIALDGSAALPYLGLGWDLERGARYAGRIGGIPGENGSPATASHWLDRALESYRQAYDRAAKRELEKQYYPPGYEAISQEAAERIVTIQRQRLKESKQDLPDARAEIARLEKSIASLRKMPRAVTPLIFSFREGTSLRDLVAPDVHVAFDLDGLGGGRWSWLQPFTGILVWDPGHTGAIQSGLQLFGSVTWWMFWHDGFRAVSALDDNHDGWLSGTELTGLAVWIDRNQNGRTDPGEVISLADAGIARINVAAAAGQDGILENPRGIEFFDGRRTPVYDWIAEGHKQRSGVPR